MKIITVETASKLLSDAALFKLRNAVDIFIAKEKIDMSYFVAVQGSLAASQFTFTSDLDLIFMSGNEKDNFQLEKTFTKLFHSLQKELQEGTYFFKFIINHNMSSAKYTIHALTLIFGFSKEKLA